MEYKKFYKQIMNYNKSAHDNIFDVTSKYYEESQQFMTKIVQKMGVPMENKTIEQWSNAWKDGQQNYKKNVDLGFQRLEAYFESI